MDTAANIAALERAGNQWNAGNLDGYLKLYRHDVTVHGYAGVEPGFENCRNFYRSFWAAFPGSTLRFEDTFGAADKVTCRFTVSGRHTGPFQGLPPSRRPFSLPGITILRFDGGLCVERWSQADFLSLMQQLGAIPG